MKLDDFLDDGEGGQDTQAGAGGNAGGDRLDDLIANLNGESADGALTPEEIAAEAAMEEGYGTAQGADPMNKPGATPGKKPDATDEFEEDEPAATTGAATTPEKAAAAAPAQQEVEIVPGYTASKLVDALKAVGQIDGLRQQADRLAGQVGSVQDTVKRVMATGGGKLDAAKLKRVTQEFGPEYAQALAEDLNEAFGQGGSSGMTEDQVAAVVQGHMQQQLMPEIQKIHKSAVRRAHPDAEQFFKGGPKHDVLLAYVKELPEDKAAEFVNTWDSEIITGHLDAIKERLTKAEAEKAKAATDGQRQRRLRDRSTVPTGGTAGATEMALSEEDQMEAGWAAAGGSARGTRGKR